MVLRYDRSHAVWLDSEAVTNRCSGREKYVLGIDPGSARKGARLLSPTLLLHFIWYPDSVGS